MDVFQNIMRYFLLALLGMLSLSSYAQYGSVPAAPYPVVLDNGDGTKLTIYGKGDAFNAYTVTSDGFTVMKNPEGRYEYARLDKNGKLNPSGFLAKDQEFRLSQEKSFLFGTPKGIRQLASDQNYPTMSSESDEPKQSFPSSGNRKVLLLLIEFPDLPSKYTSSQIEDLLNVGSNSFRQYYLDNSDGDLTLTVEAAGWYTASYNYLYYGYDNSMDRARELAAEAIDAAEAAGVDFSEYTSGSIMDNLMIVHAGQGAELGGQTEYIWSHSWNILGSRTYDGITLDDYVIMPETRNWGSGEELVGIGVFCHEFGHALGLPDLYDTDGSSEGLGDWCLMASGSWNGREDIPSNMSAWCKEELGWISPTVISSSGNYTLRPGNDTRDCYKIQIPGDSEYFLLENRYNKGWDSALDGDGMAIFHIDPSVSSDNDNENHKLVDLEEADGNLDLDLAVNDGDSGDLFPGSTNNTSFSDATNPNAISYNSNLSGISVVNIAENGENITFSLGELVTPGPNLTYDPAENNLSVNGTNLQVDLKLMNDGDQNAGAFSIGYYMSENTSVTTSDILMGTDSYSSLAASASVSESFSVDISTIPSLELGDYYVGYIIDYLNQENDETDEGDNSFLFTNKQVSQTQLPNLTFDVNENNLIVDGTNVTVSLQVENQGGSTADVSIVGYYLSDDANITSSDRRFGTDNVSILNAGGSSNENITVDILSAFPSLPPGQYYIGYMIDYESAVDESNEADNDFVFTESRFEYCPTDVTNIEAHICEGETYIYGGSNYTSSGIRNFTFTNQFGCDSVVILDLSVHPNATLNIEATICEGDTYQVGGSVYNSSGLYTDILETKFGCDSTVHLNLEVVGTQIVDIDTAICFGETFKVGGSVYFETGNYTNTLISTAGCDSVVNLTLHVYPKNETSSQETICEGDTVWIGTLGFYATGTYTEILENKFGCDSTVTLDLTVNPSYNLITNMEICEGETVLFGETVLSETGTYSEVFETKDGCDSLITLNLTVFPVHHIELNKMICAGETFQVGENEYSSEGSYVNNLKNSFGCDSIVTLNLSINHPSDTVFDASICAGESFKVGTFSYTESGAYTNVLEDKFGCDSTVTVNLTVHPINEVFLNEAICIGDSISIGSSIYTEEGNYTDILSNKYGCDSIVHLELQINPVHDVLLEEIICEGESVLFGEVEFTETGIYVQELKNKFGCDSIVTLHLTVNPVNEIELDRSICHGESYEISGNLFEEAGDYDVLLKNKFNCDSLIVLHLTVHPVHDTILEESICEGETYTVGSSVYSQSGTYLDSLVNQFGCDSIVHLNLTVNPVHATETDMVICEGESYLFAGQAYSSSGAYEHTFTNKFGCDSVVTLNLDVAFNPIVFLGNDTLIYTSQTVMLDAGAGYVDYVWNTGETSSSIEIDKTLGLGTNEVSVSVVDLNNCYGADDILITILDDSNSPDSPDKTIKLFPNPASTYIYVLLEEIRGDYEIRIIGEAGNLLYSKEGRSNQDKLLEHVFVGYLRNGIYTVQVITDEGIKADKVIVVR